jgi:hypothetical protein
MSASVELLMIGIRTENGTTAQEVPLIPSTDAGLAQVRELFGDGSEAFYLNRDAMVVGLTDKILATPHNHWHVRARVLATREPELGALVSAKVHARAAEIVMAAAGAWLEDLAPWLFEEIADPFVCPGCFALGGAPCAEGCPDAAMERDREDARDGFYQLGDERFDEDDDDA